MSSHTSRPRPDDRQRGLTHPLDVAYLVVGLVLLGVAGIWALSAADLVDTRQTSLLLPLVLVAAGVLGLVAFTAKGLSARRQERTTDDAGEPLEEVRPADDETGDEIGDQQSDQTLRLDDLRG